MVRKLIPTTLVLLSLGMGAALAGPTTIAYTADSSVLASRVEAAAAAYCAVTPETKHLIAPAFAAAASSACIKQVSHNMMVEILAMKSAGPQLALR